MACLSATTICLTGKGMGEMRTAFLVAQFGLAGMPLFLALARIVAWQALKPQTPH